MTTFAALGVPAPLCARLDALGLTQPFPVQAVTLPDALAGRDVCGKAPTGSGKTIAFGLPLLARVDAAGPQRPTALVLVPTRELASQVQEQLEALSRGSRTRVLAVYGGAGMGRQVQALARGVEVVVATPGRLKDLLDRRALRLDDVGIAVVDEADRMADMGFLPEVRRLLDRTRPDRQTLLFSATLDGDVDVLIRNYQRAPVHHEAVSLEQQGEVTHRFWAVSPAERVEVAAAIVERSWPAIVFSRTKHGAERLSKQLNKAGLRAEAIHGDRSQNRRERALAGFSRGDVHVLVATDVAARGIHVDGVACVLQFDPPTTDKDYIHRSGRTGRAGQPGTVVTLVLPEKRGDVAKLQRALGQTQPLEQASVATAATILASAPPVRSDPPAERERRAEQATTGGRRPSTAPGGQKRRRQARGAGGSTPAVVDWSPRPKGPGSAPARAGGGRGGNPARPDAGSGRPSGPRPGGAPARTGGPSRGPGGPGGGRRPAGTGGRSGRPAGGSRGRSR